MKRILQLLIITMIAISGINGVKAVTYKCSCNSDDGWKLVESSIWYNPLKISKTDCNEATGEKTVYGWQKKIYECTLTDSCGNLTESECSGSIGSKLNCEWKNNQCVAKETSNNTTNTSQNNSNGCTGTTPSTCHQNTNCEWKNNQCVVKDTSNNSTTGSSQNTSGTNSNSTTNTSQSTSGTNSNAKPSITCEYFKTENECRDIGRDKCKWDKDAKVCYDVSSPCRRYDGDKAACKANGCSYINGYCTTPSFQGRPKVNTKCTGAEDIPVALPTFIKNIINLVKIAVPIFLIIMGMIDFAKAVASIEEKNINDAKNKFIKRTIGAIAVFLVIAVVQFVFSALNNATSSEMVACINYFINGEDTIDPEEFCKNSCYEVYGTPTYHDCYYSCLISKK